MREVGPITEEIINRGHIAAPIMLELTKATSFLSLDQDNQRVIKKNN